MKAKTKSPYSLTRAFAGLTLPGLLAVALALPGCATRRQVADIVARSNAAMLAGQFGLPNPGPDAKQPSWQEASDRIDTFIAAHPDQAATTAPLRIRQAMLLLGHHQFALAQGAFDAAMMGDLHTDRDKALKRSQESLIWWFGASTNDAWTTSDKTQSQSALNQLRDEQAALAESPQIRDYLAEMRAWIGLSAAKQTTSTNQAREFVEDALNVYAEIFTPNDLVVLKGGKEDIPDPHALTSDVRRRLRAKAVLDFAHQVNKQNQLHAHPDNTFFDTWVNK